MVMAWTERDTRLASGPFGLAEPSLERLVQAHVRTVPYPGDVAIGPDQHGPGPRDGAEHRQLPGAFIAGVDPAYPLRPRRNVDAVRIAKVEQHGASCVQQAEHASWAGLGAQIEI